MSESVKELARERQDTLSRFLDRWQIETVKAMTLQEYNTVGSRDSFCYWLEHESDGLGLIGGTPSNKFGIWQIKNAIQGTSVDFLDDGNYKWYKKYGNTADVAFKKIKELVLTIIENSESSDFQNIDGIDYFSLAKWKIAFIYSKNKLFPVYNKTALRQIAKNFDYSNYRTGRLSSIHQFLVTQTPESEDLFEFAFRQYHVAVKKLKKNYYVIGSKYRDDSDTQRWLG